MARIPRRLLNTRYLHVVNRSIRRVPIFARRTDYQAFLATLREGLERHPVALLCYCVLPNHWHLVVEPTGTPALIGLMHWVTTTHAVRWHYSHQTVGLGPLYQGRYHATAIDAADTLVRVCRYVERNALAAGLVTRAEEWPWSSLADRLRGGGDLPLKTAPFLTNTAWLQHVNAPTEAERLATLTAPDAWPELRPGRRRQRAATGGSNGGLSPKPRNLWKRGTSP